MGDDPKPQEAPDALAAMTNLGAQLAVLQAQVIALRFALHSVIALHPDKKALAANFSQGAEHAMADASARAYPEAVVQLIRREFEELRTHLDGIAREVNRDTK